MTAFWVVIACMATSIVGWLLGVMSGHRAAMHQSARLMQLVHHRL